MDLILRAVMICIAIFALVKMLRKFDKKKHNIPAVLNWIQKYWLKYSFVFLLLYAVYVSFLNTRYNKDSRAKLKLEYELLDKLDSCQKGLYKEIPE